MVAEGELSQKMLEFKHVCYVYGSQSMAINISCAAGQVRLVWKGTPPS